MANKDGKDSRYEYGKRGASRELHDERSMRRDLLNRIPGPGEPQQEGPVPMPYYPDKDDSGPVPLPNIIPGPGSDQGYGKERMSPEDEKRFLDRHEFEGNQIMDKQVRRSAGPGKAY